MERWEYFKGLLPKDWEWVLVSREFKPGLVKEWKEVGFSLKEVKEWISIGLGVEDYEFAYWLKSQGKDAEWILNYGNERELREKYEGETK